MVACYHGFQSVVALLSRCPFLDVNQQDKERTRPSCWLPKQVRGC